MADRGWRQLFLELSSRPGDRDYSRGAPRGALPSPGRQDPGRKRPVSSELHYRVPAAFLIPSQSSVWPLPACPQPYTDPHHPGLRAAVAWEGSRAPGRGAEGQPQAGSAWLSVQRVFLAVGSRSSCSLTLCRVLGGIPGSLLFIPVLTLSGGRAFWVHPYFQNEPTSVPWVPPLAPTLAQARHKRVVWLLATSSWGSGLHCEVSF